MVFAFLCHKISISQKSNQSRITETVGAAFHVIEDIFRLAMSQWIIPSCRPTTYIKQTSFFRFTASQEDRVDLCSVSPEASANCVGSTSESLLDDSLNSRA